MPKGELETLLKKVRHAEPIPGFEDTWRQAETLQSPKRNTSLLPRRVLIPVAAAAILALLLVVGIQVALQSNGNDQILTVQNGIGDPSQSLARLTDMEPWTGKLDGLGTEWTFGFTTGENTENDAVDTSVMVASTSLPGDDMYESQTDFLLDLEIPTSIRAEERNRL